MTTTHDPPPSDGSQVSLCEVELVVRAQQGDHWAFDELYRKYNDRINLYITRMVGNDDVGKDLTQDTFMKAWESLLSLRDVSRFRSWLYRIATNMVFNYEKRSKTFEFISIEFYMYNNNELVSNVFEDMIGNMEIISQALSQVSPTYRPCLILYVVEELSQQQIADILDMKVNNVSKYVSRGKEDLRQVYLRLLNGQSTAKRRKDQ